MRLTWTASEERLTSPLELITGLPVGKPPIKGGSRVRVCVTGLLRSDGGAPAKLPAIHEWAVPFTGR